MLTEEGGGKVACLEPAGMEVAGWGVCLRVSEYLARLATGGNLLGQSGQGVHPWEQVVQSPGHSGKQ